MSFETVLIMDYPVPEYRHLWWVRVCNVTVQLTTTYESAMFSVYPVVKFLRSKHWQRTVPLGQSCFCKTLDHFFEKPSRISLVKIVVCFALPFFFYVVSTFCSMYSAVSTICCVYSCCFHFVLNVLCTPLACTHSAISTPLLFPLCTECTTLQCALSALCTHVIRTNDVMTSLMSSLQ